MNRLKYNHKAVSAVAYALTLGVMAWFSAVQFFQWERSLWLRTAVFNVGYVTLLAFLFYKSGMVEPRFWFRKYVLTYSLLLALFEYNLLIVRFILAARPDQDASFLLNLCFASMLYALPFLALLFVMSLFIKKKA